MFVFRNTLGFYQHKRLQSPVGDIDFTGDGGGVTPPPSNPQDSPDINGGKGSDINGNDNPDKDKDKDNPDGGTEPPANGGEGKDGKGEKDNNPSTGELEEGTNIELDGVTYTVDKDGNVVDADGKIFKEAKDVQEWLKTFNVDNQNPEDKELSIASIQKAIGEEIVDEKGQPIEFTNDVEGVKSYIDNVIALRSNELQQAAVNKVFNDNPILAQFANYLAVTGSPRGFGEMPDRSGIKLDANNEEQQIAIIKAAAKEFGNTTLNDNYIKYLKDGGGLYDEAKLQLQNLQNADKQRNEEYARQAEAQRKEEEEATNAYWENVHEKLNSHKIGEYQLPESFVREVNGQKITTTIDDFFNYIYRATEDEDGNYTTAYQKDLKSRTADDNINEQLIAAWLTFTGGSYKDLVNMAVREKEVKTLRLKAKENDGRKTVVITKPANANKTIDIDNLVF